MTETYAVGGLRVRSEVPLPLPRADGPGPDVDIVWGPDVDAASRPDGEVVAELSISPDDWWYVAVATSSGTQVRFRDRGDFLVSEALDRVVVRPAGPSTRALLGVLLTGTMMALLLTLRGRTVLHASAVDVEGTALAFVGRSGQGKSTIAALLCRAGAELVADDVLVARRGTRVSVIGGAVELRLRDRAAPIAADLPAAQQRVTVDDRTAVSFDPAPVGPMPLAAVVAPAPSRNLAEVEIEQLEPTRALVYLMSTPRIHGWRRPDVLSRDLDVLSAIADRVPVYRVRIPWGPPFDDSIAHRLMSLAAAPSS